MPIAVLVPLLQQAADALEATTPVGNLTEREQRWATFLAKRETRDFACAECYPDSRTIIGGFQCARHEARALLHATTA